jgi:hypothetical protein
MSRIEEFAQQITRHFSDRTFTKEEAFVLCNLSIPESSFNNYFSGSVASGCIQKVGVKSDHEGLGRKPAIYKVIRMSYPSISRTLTKRQLPSREINDFADERYPAKAYITNSFYTIFSAHCTNVSSVLALCGTNVERFMSNILRFIDTENGYFKLVECDEDRAAHIVRKIEVLSKRYNVPQWELDNTLLEHLDDGIFYQFQELDCEGNWNINFGKYVSRLATQSVDTESTKGFIFTVYERGAAIQQSEEKIKRLLNIIGTRIEGSLFKTDKRRIIPGNWHHVHLYNDYILDDAGRMKDLVLYRYSQSGFPMLTGLIIYK